MHLPWIVLYFLNVGDIRWKPSNKFPRKSLVSKSHDFGIRMPLTWMKSSRRKKTGLLPNKSTDSMSQIPAMAEQWLLSKCTRQNLECLEQFQGDQLNLKWSQWVWEGSYFSLEKRIPKYARKLICIWSYAAYYMRVELYVSYPSGSYNHKL